MRVAWLSLDEGDSDAARFLAYLVAALQTAVPGIGEGALRALESPGPPAAESVLTTLLNELATVPGDVVLVLDDYHAVDAPPVDQALAFMLEHLPPRTHLVIATREDPDLPLARLRARGQLVELRAADLRFTPAEVAEFLTRAMGLDLAAADIAALETRTEGWIAGLQMAAIALQAAPAEGRADTEGRPDAASRADGASRSDAAAFIQAFTGSHRFVMDYLVEEILRRQPEAVRDFLLQTSILDRLCGSLCDAVTGRDDGRRTLESLERGNRFVVPLDDRREWYRYHHLFGDVLRVHLLQEQAGRIPGLHRRASEWYEQNGSRPDAIRHALLSEDFDWAAGLIELAGPLVEQTSTGTIWRGWVRALPDEVIRARPVLCGWHAYALMGTGDLEVAESWLVDAERWLSPADGPRTGMVIADHEALRLLPATIAIARAYAAQSRRRRSRHREER